MTITTPKPGQERQRRTAPRIDWTAVQSGLWVGKANGEFAGMIEAQWDGGFAATTRFAKSLGVFATMDQAKASFTD